jgi:hypothetical protein
VSYDVASATSRPATSEPENEAREGAEVRSEGVVGIRRAERRAVGAIEM